MTRLQHWFSQRRVGRRVIDLLFDRRLFVGRWNGRFGLRGVLRGNRRRSTGHGWVPSLVERGLGQPVAMSRCQGGQHDALQAPEGGWSESLAPSARTPATSLSNHKRPQFRDFEMVKRGRKSAAEMSVVRVALEGRRPPAPDDLTAQQAQVWHEIVESVPGGWISPAQEPLLAAYCRHVSAADRLSAMIDRCEPDLKDAGALQRFGKLLAMRERETKALSSLATRMRLTQQSQMHPRTAARAMSDAHGGPKLWDRRPPWEDV